MVLLGPNVKSKRSLRWTKGNIIQHKVSLTPEHCPVFLFPPRMPGACVWQLGVVFLEDLFLLTKLRFTTVETSEGGGVRDICSSWQLKRPS